MMKRICNYFAKNSVKIAISYSLLIVVLLVIPTSSIHSASDTMRLDKLVHFGLFLFHFILTSLALRNLKNGKIKSLLISISFAIFTEFLQFSIPYRSMEFYDFIADSCGVFVGYTILSLTATNNGF